MVFSQTRQMREGFTLIELMIALIVVGIVFVGGFIAFRDYTERAKKTATKEALNANAAALMSYHADVGNYPKKLKFLIKKPTGPEEAEKWDGPYGKEKAHKDGWGKSFAYKPSNDQQSYELYSQTKKNLRVTSE